MTQITQALEIAGAYIYIKKMTDFIPGGDIGIVLGSGGSNGELSAFEMVSIKGIADIPAGSSFDLTNATYFSPTLSKNSDGRVFNNFLVYNWSDCPIEIYINNSPDKLFRLTASSEFLLQAGTRILQVKNLGIKNISAIGEIQADDLLIVMW